MRPLKRLLAIGLGLALLAFAWLQFTLSWAADLPPLKRGDIIFQTSTSSQSLAILFASASPYSHMGLIDFNADGKPVVYEAVGPVKATPLDEWIKRGLGKRITVKRLGGLTDQQTSAILQAAHAYDGRPYDTNFMPEKEHIYCSELVRLAYAEGAGLDLGEMQKVSSLHIDNPAARRLIQKRWRNHPLCQARDTADFATCFSKIKDQELITPQSIADDKRLQVIFTNFGALTR